MFYYLEFIVLDRLRSYFEIIKRNTITFAVMASLTTTKVVFIAKIINAKDLLG